MHIHVIAQQGSRTGLRGLTAALDSLGHTTDHHLVPGPTVSDAADLSHLIGRRPLAGPRRPLAEPADVVLASGWLAGLTAQMVTRDSGTPVVQRLFAPGRSPDPQRRRLEGAIARGAARCLALCSDDADQLIGLGVRRSNIRVVPHGVDTAAFRDKGPTWPTTADRRLVARPRADRADRAPVAELVSLLPSLPHSELVLLTTSPTRAAVSDAVSAAVSHHPVGHRVTLLDLDDMGQDGSPDDAGTLGALLRSADAVITTGDDEPELELALAAMACGVPVVARACGTMTDVVADSVTGVLAPSGSSDALADALRGLLGDDLRRESLGFAAGDRARAAFAWTTVATMLARVTAEVAGHSPADALARP